MWELCSRELMAYPISTLLSCQQKLSFVQGSNVPCDCSPSQVSGSGRCKATSCVTQLCQSDINRSLSDKAIVSHIKRNKLS